MGILPEISPTGNQLPPASWPVGELSFLLENGLELAFRDYRHDPRMMLQLFAQPIENKAKKYGPLPDSLRGWLTIHVNAIKGYEQAKREFWNRIVPYYQLSETPLPKRYQNAIKNEAIRQSEPPADRGQIAGDSQVINGQPHGCLDTSWMPTDRPQIAHKKNPHAITDTPCNTATPVDERSVEPLQADHGQVLVDVEAYRWSYAAGQGPHFMLYSLAAHLAHNGRVDIDTLAATAGHSQSYFYELLALREIEAGDSLFYRARNGQWLYIRSQQAIGARLALLLVENDLHSVLDGRRPGIRRRYVAFNAEQPELFAAWLDSKRSTRISRQTLAQLWNVTEQTVIRWDKAAGIDAQKNFAQTADLRDERAPADREDYKLALADGAPVAMWQQANTYHVKQTFREHPHKGQARKVRKAISAALSTEQPVDNLATAHPFRTHNFAGGGDPTQAWKDYQQALKNKPFAHVTDYLYRGERRTRGLRRPAIWELMTPRPGQDSPRTSCSQFVRVN